MSGTGMLGTALNPVNPAVAGNLMWAWQQSNSASVLTEDSQFVTTLAAIDPTIPAVEPQLGSINVPGYHSAERHNFGTAERNRGLVHQRGLLFHRRTSPLRRRSGIDLRRRGAAGDRLEREPVFARDPGPVHARLRSCTTRNWGTRGTRITRGWRTFRR
jgi:hypothetical protein